METKSGGARMKKMNNRFYLYFFLVSLIVAGFLSFYASSHPDGLEKVAEDVGFLETAQDSAVSGSPLADYGVSGLENARISVGASGVIGVIVTGIAAYLIFSIAKRIKKRKVN
jgi:cobalt/nickel transport protein